MSSIPEYSTRFGSTPADSGVTSSLDLYGRGFKLRVYKWVTLINSGAESPKEQGQDSFLSLATELVGGDENFQALAKKQSEGNSSIVTVVLNPATNLTADIKCQSGFDSSGKDVSRFYPQMVNISVPTHFTPAGSELPINPAAELVGTAIRSAFVAEAV